MKQAYVCRRFTYAAILACLAAGLAGAAEPVQTSAQPTSAKADAQTIRVAAVQMRGVRGGIAANQAKAEELIRKAADQGARYVLLPELYALFPVAIWAKTVDEVRAEAQAIPGPLTERMTALARELKIHLAFGMVEKRGDAMFNTVVFLGPEGISDTYSKRCLVTHEGLRKLAEKRSGKPAAPPSEPQGPDEADLFQKGTKDGLVRWGNLQVGTLICADGGFDGWWKDLAARGAQLFVYPVANSGGPLLEPPFPDEIARKYGIPMIFANHLPDQMLHIGNSQVINAQGEIVAKSVSAPDTVVVGDVKLASGKAPAATLASAAPPQPAGLPADHPLRLVSVQPDRTLEAMLRMRENGWLGSDVGESIVLSEDKTLWLFGDTFIGALKDGVRVPGARMINSTIAIQDRQKPPPDSTTFYWKKENGRPVSFFPHKPGTPGDLYWVTSGVMLRGELLLYGWGLHMAGLPEGSFGIDGSVLIRVPNPLDPPEQWRQQVHVLELPKDTEFHSALFVEEPYVYFYGRAEKKSALARARIDDLLRGGLVEVYEYWVTGPQGPHWGKDPKGCVEQFYPAVSECTVSYHPEWDLYTCFTYFGFAPDIYLTTAKELTGPWSKPATIYRVPEHGSVPFNIISYAVREHPELATQPGELIVSYATNAPSNVGALFTETGKGIYVHRFLRLQLEKNQ